LSSWIKRGVVMRAMISGDEVARQQLRWDRGRRRLTF